MLTIDGQRLNPLSVDDLQYFETRFFLVPGTGTVYIDAKLSVIRQRAVGGGFHEELTILNHDEKAVDLEVRIEAGCDFADLFEVKDALKKKGEYYTQRRRRPPGARLQARDLRARDLDLGDGAPAASTSTDSRSPSHVEPHGRVDDGPPRGRPARGVAGLSVEQPKYERGAKKARPHWSAASSSWLDEAPRLDCDWDPLKRPTSAASSTWRRCASRRPSWPGH